MKGIDCHNEVKGSNPSHGAYFESISNYPELIRAKILSIPGFGKTNFNNLHS